MGTKNCLVCNKKFIYKHKLCKYCSDECRKIENKRQQKRWYEENKEHHYTYHKQWKKNNKNKIQAIKKREQQKNLSKYNANNAKRRSIKLQATPLWANEKYIKLFYTLAKVEEERTGKKVNVDHIIPLKGKTVCGLHCEDNLQLLFEIDNKKKSNLLLEENINGH